MININRKVAFGIAFVFVNALLVSIAIATSERKSPDAILTQTGLTGSVTAIQDDPDSPDGSWLTAPQGTATTLRVSFPTPTDNLTTGAGVQQFKFWIRKTATNNNKTDDTYTVHLYENGVLRQSTIASGGGVPSSGTLVTATWDASNLSSIDGSQVEAYITTTSEGAGSPGSRGSIEIGAVEWNVEYSANTAPTISISQPDGTSDTVAENSSYNITYTLSDTENTVTAAFYYDTDNLGLDGTAISGACATAAEGSGATCSWNTSGVTPGSYYVYGITNDGSGDISAYSSGQITINDAPTISVSQPDGTGDTVTVGDSYNITYNLTDSDNTVTAAFYYDTDNLGLDGIAISGACATAAEGSGATCSWDTTGVTPGSYYVYGVASDGINSSASAYSSGQITINSANTAPTISISQPDGTSDTVVVGDSYNITYDLADSENTVTAAFYYDTDNLGLDGTAISGACATAAEGSGATCSWNTSGVTPGAYYIYGVTNDGSGDVTDYSFGQITISAVVVSISLDRASFDYGTVPKDTASSTLALWSGAGITATNDGNVTANLDIYGADTTGGGTNWVLDTTNSTLNHYIHQFCNDTDSVCSSPPTNYTALTTSPSALKSGVAPSGSVSFQLRLTTPQTVSDYNQQSATVTVQASQ